jgi:hypothetical protein
MIAVSFGPYPLPDDVYDRAHSCAAAAHHESGHACIAMSFGIKVTRVDLVCCHTLRRDDPMGGWMQAVVALSGPASEQRYVGYPHGAVMRLKGSNWKDDYRNALCWLELISGVSLEQAERMAKHLVGQHWDAIGRVAQALAEEGELSGVELERHWRG